MLSFGGHLQLKKLGPPSPKISQYEYPIYPENPGDETYRPPLTTKTKYKNLTSKAYNYDNIALKLEDCKATNEVLIENIEILSDKLIDVSAKPSSSSTSSGSFLISSDTLSEIDNPITKPIITQPIITQPVITKPVITKPVNIAPPMYTFITYILNKTLKVPKKLGLYRPHFDEYVIRNTQLFDFYRNWRNDLNVKNYYPLDKYPVGINAQLHKNLRSLNIPGFTYTPTTKKIRVESETVAGQIFKTLDVY